eukprot:12442028-Alexandrium_andersonii.AAC.1
MSDNLDPARQQLSRLRPATLLRNSIKPWGGRRATASTRLPEGRSGRTPGQAWEEADQRRES